MIVSQSDFSGGVDLVSDDTNISETGYRWLLNARQRYGKMQAVTQATLLSTPTGKKQGCIAVGNVQVLFINGHAFYQLVNTNVWIEVPNLQLDATVDQLYAIAVPASSLNYVRKLNPDGNVSSAILQTLDFRPQGSPACILVQDGINQPWLITFDETTNAFSSRVTQNYAGWANTDIGQEYVPIGTTMLFLNQILFIVAPDGTEIYRSVSGQPLNFMVNITNTGDKLPTEDAGGAITTSFAFDYDPVTALIAVNIPNSFIYATRNTTRVITLDYTSTIFGEPLFDQSAIISAGILNNYSVADILGDYAFVDYEGITSFNAVQQLKFSGRNSIFSFAISNLFKDIKQTYTVAIPFNNFVLFNVDTIWGNIIAVYDTLVSQWVAFDILGIARIKQYALVDTEGDTQLIVVTTDDNVYQLYSNTAASLQASLLTRAFTSTSGPALQTDTSTNEIKSNRFELIFYRGTVNGIASVTEVCDGSTTNALTQSVEGNDTQDISPINLVTTKQYNEQIKRNTFVFRDSLKGYKLSYLISWTSDAAMQKLKLYAGELGVPVGKSQKP